MLEEIQSLLQIQIT